MPTWKEVTAANPAHSHNFARKWKMLEAQGQDIHGESRLIDAMAERGSRVLDAGCGTGRLGGRLAALGHDVLGVDVDPILIEHAVHDFPEGDWRVGDLSEDAIEEHNFDIAVAAGNVVGFFAPEGREAAYRNIFNALKPGGRFVVALGAGRGWEFDDMIALAEAVGFVTDYTFSSWDLKPFGPNSTFLVVVFRRPNASSLLA
ncbi:class I SAM-dependent methyltransferase [Corynebacterium phoceense]|uniref:class I SAM-dependent methyltransferase n=1 Tax=Corynebacterium phoceense TaxID=1686286 RepID=UPI00211BDDDD|nr:class I SAM-dependent methyltransferase [Corynebacterium phoceense]MCQ9332536.1 class I SAM-dependent methyltransferase [Corynebacterium phoceense]MCQ9336655.1 class I SAM-dependent methyltransferase [Corynebacterium phoceense]